MVNRVVVARDATTTHGIGNIWSDMIAAKKLITDLVVASSPAAPRMTIRGRTLPNHPTPPELADLAELANIAQNYFAA